MSPKVRKNLTLIAAVVATFTAVIWTFAQIQASRPDSSINNGLNSSIPGPPPEAAKAMRKMMEARRARGQAMPMPPREGQPFDREAARAAMADVLTPEEQQAMRDGMQRMMQQRQKVQNTLGPAEARAFEGKIRTRMRQMMQSGGFGPPGPPPTGE